jgi:hypothetical protein
MRKKSKPKLRHFFYVGIALAFLLGVMIVVADRDIGAQQLIVCSAGITALSWFIVKVRTGG